MKKLIAIILCLAGLLSITACSSKSTSSSEDTTKANETSTAQSGDPIVITIASAENEQHPSVVALKSIKEKVEAETNGGLVLDIYANGTLGDYMTVFDEVMLGTIDMSLQSLASTYDKRLDMFTMPYLFSNSEEAKKVCVRGANSYEYLAKVLSDLDIKLLGYYCLGYTGTTATFYDPNYFDPTVKKDEIIRSYPSDSNRLTVEAFNFPCVTMNFSEVYTSLQTGVVQASFGNIPQQAYDNWRDICSYYYYDKATSEHYEFLINQDKWNSLPEEYQQILDDACAEACLNSFDEAGENGEEYMDAMRDFGMEVITISDEEMETFAAQIREIVWPEMAEGMGEEVLEVLQSDLNK